MGYEQRFSTFDVPRPEKAQADAVSPRGFMHILLLLAAAGIAARFYAIGSRTLWLDESYSAWFSALDWNDLWLLTPKYETHPPFFYSLLKAWTLLFGDGPAGLRSLTAAAGVAAIPVMVLAALDLAKLVTVRRPLLFVGAVCVLMALSPRLVIAAQDARPYGVLLLAYAVAIMAWLRLSRSFASEKGSAGRIADWAMLGTATSFVLWLHALGILHAAALFTALLITSSDAANAARWRRLLATVTLCGLSYVPCLAMMLGRSGDWSSGWLTWEPALFPGQLMNLYGQLQIDEPVTPVIVAVVTCGLLWIALRSLWRGERRGLAIALGVLTLFPPLAAGLISQLGIPVFLPRTMLAVSAPAYLLAGFGLAQLPKRHLRPVGALFALSLGANLAQALVRPSNESWSEVAAILDREVMSGELIWVYPNESVLPLQAAMARPRAVTSIPAPYPAVGAAGYHVSGTPAVVALDAPLARRWMKANPSPAEKTLWLVTSKSYLFDPRQEVVKELTRGRVPGRSFGGDELKVQAWHPRTQPEGA